MLIATREKNGADAAHGQGGWEQQGSACKLDALQWQCSIHSWFLTSSSGPVPVVNVCPLRPMPDLNVTMCLALQACTCRRSSMRRSARSGASWRPEWRSWRWAAALLSCATAALIFLVPQQPAGNACSLTADLPRLPSSQPLCESDPPSCTGCCPAACCRRRRRRWRRSTTWISRSGRRRWGASRRRMTRRWERCGRGLLSCCQASSPFCLAACSETTTHANKWLSRLCPV